jgi:hypothetical protein
MIRKTLFLFCLLVPAAYAGKWNFGGKVSVVDAGNEAQLKVVGTAEYMAAAMLSWRTDLEMTFRELGMSKDFDLSIPSNLLYYPLEHTQALDPYAGPGVVYTHTWNGFDYFGINALAGVKFLLIRNQVFGVEVKYTVTDITNWSGSDNFDIGLTGSWEFEF